jgi:type IV secretory pathway VirJ component
MKFLFLIGVLFSLVFNLNASSVNLPAYHKRTVNEPEFAAERISRNPSIQTFRDSLFKTSLPLTIAPSFEKNDLPLVFFISGDGGWTNFDHAISEKLVEKGFSVIGLDAQKYFWEEKNPHEVASQIAPVVLHYMKLWDKKSFILIGYSFGACVSPFIVQNFSPQVKELVKGIYCFSPSLTGDFEIHITELLNFKTKDKYNVVNELMQVKAMNPVCVFGTNEDVEILNAFGKSGVRIAKLPGNHHYNNDFNAIVNLILNDIRGEQNNGLSR